MKRTILSGVSALALCLAAARAYACSTPVHRYAMYNWDPSPYLVCLFHDTDDAASGPVHEALTAIHEDASSKLNLIYKVVDVREEGWLDEAPPPVQSAWRAHESKPRPLHMVFSPTGALIHAGTLTRAELDELTRSKARERVAQLLQDGNHGLLVFLPGEDAERNETARAEVKKAVELARKRIALTDPALDAAFGVATGATSGDVAGDSDPAAAKIDLEVLELSRTDESSRWIVRQLLAVEALEPEDRAQPLVFGLYGRGRALKPYIGAGIVAENLLEMIGFMNGPCSCEVKDKNPGVDLLIEWDWEAGAIEMAKRVGRETGNEMLLEKSGFGAFVEEFDLPDIKVVTAADLAGEPAKLGGEDEADARAKDVVVEDVLVEAVQVTDASAASERADAGSDAAQPAPAPKAVAEKTTSRVMIVLVSVIAAAGLALVIVTFALLGRKGAA